MKSAAGQNLIRSTNQRLILDEVRAARRITRAALSQALRLSPPSVSANIDKLVQRGLLRTCGAETTEPRKTGRKGILLELNPSYTHLLCADLSSRLLKAALCDMQENILAFREAESIENENAESIQGKIESEFDELLRMASVSRHEAGMIVICSPGVIDSGSGRARCAPQFEGWEGINLKEHFKAAFSGDVLVVNDVNTMAVGELRYGIGREFDSFMHINIDLGIGAGIVLDGRLWEGAHFAAGEVGSMSAGGVRLGKGAERSSLEGEFSMPSLLGRTARKLGVDPARMDTAEFNRLYREGALEARTAADEMAAALGTAVADIASLLDLPAISLGGRVTQLDIGLPEKLAELVAAAIPFPPVIRHSALGVNSAVKGALSMGVEHVLRRAVENGGQSAGQ